MAYAEKGIPNLPINKGRGGVSSGPDKLEAAAKMLRERGEIFQNIATAEVESVHSNKKTILLINTAAGTINETTYVCSRYNQWNS